LDTLLFQSHFSLSNQYVGSLRSGTKPQRVANAGLQIFADENQTLKYLTPYDSSSQHLHPGHLGSWVNLNRMSGNKKDECSHPLV
jgi:hypothetical protein